MVWQVPIRLANCISLFSFFFHGAGAWQTWMLAWVLAVPITGMHPGPEPLPHDCSPERTQEPCLLTPGVPSGALLVIDFPTISGHSRQSHVKLVLAWGNGQSQTESWWKLAELEHEHRLGTPLCFLSHWWLITSSPVCTSVHGSSAECSTVSFKP